MRCGGDFHSGRFSSCPLVVSTAGLFVAIFIHYHVLLLDDKAVAITRFLLYSERMSTNKNFTTKEVLDEANKLLALPAGDTNLTVEQVALISRLTGALQSVGDIAQEGEVEYFVTTDFPYRWSSGAIQSVYDHRNGVMTKLTSLEHAKEVAEALRNPSSGDDHCDTTYGIKFVVPNPTVY